ncbi:MAG TPA: hypothetical protein VKZ48_07380 [Burkholderiales bacterium]|nr:hypothetical protein [Burkholderiales bacterium]
MLIPKTLTVAIVAAILFGTSVGVLAASDHAHHGGGVAHLQLNEGRKWPTDAPLRQGMGNMQAAMSQALPQIHHGKLDAAGYAALAARLEREMAYVVANCKLDPDADAQLHLVLAQLGAGLEQMKAGGDRRAGAVSVVDALDAYGTHFDHPGWHALRH